jgi:hypothetical protein
MTTVKFPRRRFQHLVAGAAALPFASLIARAQTYPTKPVRIVVGYPAGGGTDIAASDWQSGGPSGSCGPRPCSQAGRTSRQLSAAMPGVSTAKPPSGKRMVYSPSKQVKT